MKIEWDFGDGTKAFESAPTHRYNSRGTYKIKVIIYFDDNTKCYIEKNITLVDCSVSISYYEDYSYTGAGKKYNYSATPTSFNQAIPITYTWTFENGTTKTGQKTDYVYTTDGKKIVSVQVNFNDGCIAATPTDHQVTGTAGCCYNNDKRERIYYYNYNNTEGKIEHSYSANKTAWRFVVKSINYKRKGKNGWEREKASRLRVNYEGVVYKKDCSTTMQTNGNALSNTNSNSITYDKGFGENFRLKRNCTWSTFQVDKGNHQSGQCTGVYLHQFSCN
jgi:hypothetical protein